MAVKSRTAFFSIYFVSSSHISSQTYKLFSVVGNFRQFWVLKNLSFVHILFSWSSEPKFIPVKLCLFVVGDSNMEIENVADFAGIMPDKKVTLNFLYTRLRSSPAFYWYRNAKTACVILIWQRNLLPLSIWKAAAHPTDSSVTRTFRGYFTVKHRLSR